MPVGTLSSGAIRQHCGGMRFIVVTLDGLRPDLT